MENTAENLGLQTPMGLAEVLQLCCLGRRSGQITFRSGDNSGQVYLQMGQVLHAACPGSEGETAIYYMLTWPAGTYTLAEEILPHKRTVGLSWEQLLFEGARLADEGLIGQQTSSSHVLNGEEAISTSRIQGGQPKLTILVPDGPPLNHDLEEEFTHLGRAAGNDIVLPYPSISGRHCMFMLSGQDVVLRDLNSSNGTMINGRTVTEEILHLGDTIQVGGLEIKFESGVRRPKLNLERNAGTITPRAGAGDFQALTKTSDALRDNTVRLPAVASNPSTKSQTNSATPLRKDTAPLRLPMNKAISYDALSPTDKTQRKNYTFLLISVVLLILIILGGLYAVWYLAMEHKVIDIGPVHIGPF